MMIFAKFVAIVFVVEGCLLVLRPEIIKNLLKYCKEGYRVYVFGAVKGVAGLLLMLVAGGCATPWIVFIFGLLLLSGGSVFFLKKDVIDKILEWAETKPEKYVKLAGTVSLALGVLLSLSI